MRNDNKNTNFDTNPPVETGKYDESIRLFCACYESIFSLSCSYLQATLKNNSNLLIVGAGTGAEICYFGEKNSSWQFTGVDPSNDMLFIAREKIIANKIKNEINFFNGYTHELPDNILYDAATCILVMHFLKDDGSKLRLLKDINNRLKPGSPFILVDGFGDVSSMLHNISVEAWKNFVRLMGVDKQIVEDGFNNQILKRIQFVPERRIFDLLEESGFDKAYRFFTSFLYGGWITFKK